MWTYLIAGGGVIFYLFLVFLVIVSEGGKE